MKAILRIGRRIVELAVAVWGCSVLALFVYKVAGYEFPRSIAAGAACILGMLSFGAILGLFGWSRTGT